MIFELVQLGIDLAKSLLLDQALFEESSEACKIFSDLKKDKNCVKGEREEMSVISSIDKHLWELN